MRPDNLKTQAFTGLRGTVASFVENKRFTGFITILILLNAAILGMETDEGVRAQYGEILQGTDHVILGVFVLELLLKMFVYRLSFFRAGWNVFDFVIVGVSLVPASAGLSIMRALRIFRVLRLVSVVPQMRRVISALLVSIPGMASIVGVLLIIFYVSAVLATQLFGSYPDPQMQTLFGSIGASMYTLFQIMTLEGWAENVANPTIALFPWSWLFFVPFIIITSFAVLNLFIGIIVDAMQIVQEKDLAEEEATIIDEITHLREEIMALRRDVQKQKGD